MRTEGAGRESLTLVVLSGGDGYLVSTAGSDLGYAVGVELAVVFNKIITIQHTNSTRASSNMEMELIGGLVLCGIASVVVMRRA